MSFIIGIFMVILNYNFVDSVMGSHYKFIEEELLEYGYNFIEYVLEIKLYELVILISMMLFLLIITVITTDYKLYKKVINENKASGKIIIKSIIESIVIGVLSLISQVQVFVILEETMYESIIASLIILSVTFLGPFLLVKLVSYMTYRNFEKEYKKIIDRENEIKDKEREEQIALEKERNEKLKKLYSETEGNIYNIINKLDNKKAIIPFGYENEVRYIYDERLNLKSSKSKEKWLNNDEKIKYYKELFEDINSKLYGNYEEYLKYLREKEKSISYALKDFSHTFGYLTELINTNENKMNSFDKYIKARQSYIDSDYKGCKVGIEGENRVNQELSLYNNIINLSNIRLEVLDNNNTIQSIENDNILLTKNGIFVLEIKNFGEIGNYDIIIEKDGRWLRKNKYNGETTVIKNVTKQNNRHIAFLNKFINEGINRSFDDYIEVEGIVVIANEKITIENYNNNQNIFRDSELYSYIKSQEVKFKIDELEKIRDLILSKNLPPKRYPIFDYSGEIIENIKMLEAYLNDYENVVNKLEIEYRNYINKKSKI
ncbi:nuclease-related domain-containing protein [Romboutsia timonensis]|jgi:nuclease family protein|uniref:nuclease-related domain-containing protein n=1 Tax=Romboutsia timonensis TaxID=1776391 RepID=UPI0039907631